MSTKIDQKEYLKKYLSKPDKKKKRKKKQQVSDGIKIIDDDIGLAELPLDESEIDLFASAEDAPQVAAIIDERPIEMRIREKYELTNRWQEVTDENVDGNSNDNKVQDSETQIANKDDSDNDRRRTKTESRSNDSDASPPRKRDPPSKPKRTRTRWGKENSSSPKKIDDVSPPRNKVSRYDSDTSPPRRKDRPAYDSDASPPRKSKNNYDSDASPPRRRRRSASPERSDRRDRRRSRDKMKKTLDGKTAGLQNARDLKVESAAIKKRENEMFGKLSADVTGANSAPVMRDRRTGRVRDLDKEAAEQKKKEEKENAQKEKYTRWGRGLKQVDDLNEKVKDELYEMSKPLARYADDTDLENYLRNQEREGDPMLDYIRKEKRDKSVGGKSVKPKYLGSFMPNRFGIPPGYRWDGVDRSNGYEKKWFETINAKKATEEIAYKWSTEDM